MSRDSVTLSSVPSSDGGVGEQVRLLGLVDLGRLEGQGANLQLEEVPKYLSPIHPPVVHTLVDPGHAALKEMTLVVGNCLAWLLNTACKRNIYIANRNVLLE